jgi:hypothetical protein
MFGLFGKSKAEKKAEDKKRKKQQEFMAGLICSSIRHSRKNKEISNNIDLILLDGKSDSICFK